MFRKWELIPVVNLTWFDPNTSVDKNEQLVITASLFWWAAENVSIRPQIIYSKDKAKGDSYDTWRYAFMTQFINSKYFSISEQRAVSNENPCIC